MGHYYYSFKSFLYLEKFAPSIENSNGKIASASGTFFQLMSGKLSSDKMQEVIGYLVESATSSIQSEEISKMVLIFKKWGAENGVKFYEQSMYDEGY